MLWSTFYFFPYFVELPHFVIILSYFVISIAIKTCTNSKVEASIYRAGVYSSTNWILNWDFKLNP